MYRVEGLSISRKGRPIFRGASCTVRSGEVLGLVAPNGMGKTTLLRFLAGAWALGSASAVTLGNDRVRDPKSLGRHVFYVSGDRSPLYPGLSPRQHLQAVGRIWGVPVDVGGWVERCGMGGYADVPVRRLSRGMAQQALLAVAFAAGPRYLLLDEPLNGLDPTAVGRNEGIVRELVERGAGALVSSHLLPQLGRLADRLAYIDGGAIRIHGPVGTPAGAEELYRRVYGEVRDR